MNKFYFLLVFLISSAFVACDDDEVAPNVVPLQDTMNPTVQIGVPATNDTFLVIERVALMAHLEDNVGFSLVRVYLIDPDGNDSLVYVDRNISTYARILDYELGLYLHKGVSPGTYTLMVEAMDKAQNTTRSSVPINIEAPDLSVDDFSSVFESGSIFSAYDWGWFGIDFSRGIMLDESHFGYFLFFMVDELGGYDVSEAEWKKFTADFGMHNQNWVDWDENRNGIVSDAEFVEAIRKSGLFREWDTDNNAILNKEEFASGMYNRWDSNKDGLLSREEYQERFYSYLMRPSR